MSLASINVGLVQIRTLLQGMLTIGGAIQVTNKASEYDHRTWGVGDYIEIAGRTATVAADGMSTFLSWDVSNQLKKVKEIKKLSVDLKSNGLNTDELDKLLVIVQSKIESARLLQIKVQSGGAVSHTFAELGSGRRILEVLSSPMTKARLADLSFSLGQYDTSPYAIAAYSFTAYLLRDMYIQAIEEAGGVPPPIDLDYATIPQAHHQNPIFSQYVCPITLEPIRYPVRVDNGGGHYVYYELAAIFPWVQATGTNPLTRARLNLNNIQIDRAVLNQIEAEMTNLGIPLA